MAKPKPELPLMEAELKALRRPPDPPPSSVAEEMQRSGIATVIDKKAMKHMKAMRPKARPAGRTLPPSPRRFLGG